MKRDLQYRVIVILVVVAASLFALWFRWTDDKPLGINLGLDLRGGVHLVLQVQTDEALRAEANQVRERIVSNLNEKGVTFSQVRADSGLRIEVTGVRQDQQEDAELQFENATASWTWRPRFSGETVDYALELNAAARKVIVDQTVQQVREIIQNRVDQYGVAEPTITIYGSGDFQDQIIVELPGVEDFDRVIRLIQKTAKLELKLVHPDRRQVFESVDAARQSFGNQLPADYEALPVRERSETGGAGGYMLVKKAAAITGRHLKTARRGQDPFTGQSEVDFFLNAEGVRLFSDVTANNINNLLAIVLDGEIRSYPRIESKIDTETARITGSFTAQQADDLALVLRSGALPASINILENRSVGPSLGMDSIRHGIAASILGVILVVSGMFLVYRFSGVNAIVCLTLNLLILLACLAHFGATLTLPGIAGIILTIGMAVDANILIFERIKEELGLGKTVRSAVEAGFGRVFSTILDTNITTLVAALFLFKFGTGPVQGFAVTLAIGLLANIFTATFVSRTMFRVFLQSRQVVKLSI